MYKLYFPRSVPSMTEAPRNLEKIDPPLWAEAQKKI
jgi:hypothetical protein